MPGYFDIRRTLCSLSEMLSTTSLYTRSSLWDAGLHTRGAALCTNKGASAPVLIYRSTKSCVAFFFCSAEFAFQIASLFAAARESDLGEVIFIHPNFAGIDFCWAILTPS